MPASMKHVMAIGTPADASHLERFRDSILWAFAHKRVARLFMALSLLVMVSVVAWGLVIVWAVLGLFLGVQNGWHEYLPECVALAERFNQTLSPMYIPKPPGAQWGWGAAAATELHATYCTDNQFWFNASIKAFVVLVTPKPTRQLQPCTTCDLLHSPSPPLVRVMRPEDSRVSPASRPHARYPSPTFQFSYINFLPIPWRLAILHHDTCSPRRTDDGVDFYGRPTEALWFNIPCARLHGIRTHVPSLLMPSNCPCHPTAHAIPAHAAYSIAPTLAPIGSAVASTIGSTIGRHRRRRTIAVLLNLAYALHFLTLAMHAVYGSFIEGQTWPGAFAQNSPFLLSIATAIAGGVLQGKAEDALIAGNPDVYPPRPAAYLKHALRAWWHSEEKGLTLSRAVRKELQSFRVRRRWSQ